MVLLIIATFIIGYIAIAFEHTIKINKAASALITGVVCWTFYIVFTGNKDLVVENLLHHLGNLSQILFFLLGAMTIVELIDAHDGFEIITKRITTRNKKKLLWIIGLLAFFLSAVLDNLTTAIVMISLVRKLTADKHDRLMFAGAIVIAANAGGAWSPIGDVTTTMLWIGGQITAGNIILKLILPSLVCMIIPFTVMQYFLKGEVQKPQEKFEDSGTKNESHRKIVFFTGVAIFF